VINGGNFTVPDALGDKTFHPYGDFLMHNVGTGDGIVQAIPEHYGKRIAAHPDLMRSTFPKFQSTANKVRTAPLWGVRLHSRLMHDGASTTLSDAIRRHRGEAAHVTDEFEKLTPAEKKALLTFLLSL
jgi:CxxC motif-containing protein (DUF1111 family)